MKINPVVSSCFKALFNNPRKNGVVNYKTQTAIFVPLGLAAIEGAQAIKDRNNNYEKGFIDRTFDGISFLAAAAGGIFGFGGAIIAGCGFHLLADSCKKYVPQYT